MVVYFTGPGNSRYCAQMLADKLEDELIDASGFIRHGIAAELISRKPWVFVAPIYAWQMARVFADFIRSGWFQGSRDAYFVLTCGGEIGNAGESAAALAREKGLNYMGVLQVQMPELHPKHLQWTQQLRLKRIIQTRKTNETENSKT